jgi:molybdenum cofactor cytidylyltransferase
LGLDVKLSTALRLEAGRAAAFTGAGGKSAALARLAEELKGDMPVLLTTSTHLGRDQEALAAHHLVAADHGDLAAIPRLLDEHRTVLVTGGPDRGEGKWVGLPLPWIDELKTSAAAAGAPLLVEADGARGRLVKAPADHEPAIPSSVDMVVPVVGLAAVGQPLSGTIAHRLERLGEVAGMRPGEPVTVEQLVRLLSSADGGLKAVPAAAEVRPLLNGAIDEEAVSVGRQVATGAIEHRRLRAVVLADTERADPVVACIGRTAGVVLAAGGASRMGGLKQVMRWRGQPLLRLAVEAARSAGLEPIVVVLGAEADRVRAAADGMGVSFVDNRDWESGQGTSLRAGLRAARGDVEAAVFLLADMPRVGAALIERLLAAHQASLAPIVAPSFEGRRGNPVLFDRSTFRALDAIDGDRGGSVLFDRFPILSVPAGPECTIDVDQPGDWGSLGD